ncbi:MAG: hypothetical protein HY902_16135 [Deltaproteobacteria bacterium]|nr:hypothetical protein [Deltaproteobacteria bacterium]
MLTVLFNPRLTALLVAVCALAAGSTALATEDPKWYQRNAVLIRASHSNLCLQRHGTDHLTQEQCDSNNVNQLWVVYQEVHTPCYRSVNGVCKQYMQYMGRFLVRAFDGASPTDMCLSVPTYTSWPASWFWRTSTENAWLTPCDATADMETNGYPWNFRPVNSNFCADVEKQAWWTGAWIKGWECNGGQNQRFYAETVRGF